MASFHIPTAFLIVGLLYLVMPMVTWVVLSSRRSSAVALWCGGDIFFGLGIILLGLRGHVPEWATFPLANLLMFIAIIQHIQSLRLDLAVPWPRRVIALAALLFMLGFEGIRLGVGDALLRLQYNHSIWAVMYVYIAVLAWRIGHLERSRSARWIAGVLLLLAVAMLHSLIRISIGLSPPDPLNSNPSNIFLALAGTLAAVIGNIAYVGLAFERSQRQTAVADKQYHDIIETTADGFYCCDVAGRFADVNRAFCDMLGYSRDELLGMRVHDVEANETAEEMAFHVQQIIMTGADRFETLYRRKDGHLLNVELSANFQPNEAGNFLVFARDISERKQIEASLRESETLLREAIEFSPIPLCVADNHGNIRIGNRQFTEVFGYTLDDVPTIDEWMTQAYPNVDYRTEVLAQWNQDVATAIQNGTATTLREYKVTGKSGTQYDVEITSKFLGNISIASFNNITQRNKTERELRASEEFLREMSQIAKVGGWNLDLKTKQLTWTEEVYRIREVDLNYQPQLEEGIRFYLPEARTVLTDAMECAQTQGVPYDLELPGVTAKGNPIWVRTIGNAEKVDGQVVRLYGVLQDITERKRAEKEWRESEAKFRLAFSNANTGMCLVDMQGNLLQVNAKMSAIFGYSHRELESMSVNDFTLPDDASLSPDFIHHAVQGDGDSATFEMRYRHRQGHIIHGQVSSSLVRDSQGQPRYFISQVQDITERKQAEDALRESEEKFKALADTSPLAIYVSEGIEQTYEYINPTALRLFGYTLDETPTVEQWWPLAYPDETYRRQIVEEWQHKVQYAIETHSEIEPMEVVVTCKDGSHKIIQWGFKAIGKQNWAFGLDLTERKQAEEEIKQLAFYDPLTQLPNRRLLLDRLQQALVTSVRSGLYDALLLIDLDNFKTLNDTLGHDKGDLLLQQVASRLVASVRECDTVARFGGDEFVVVLTGLDGDLQEADVQAQKVGYKIIETLNEVYCFDGHEHYCSASIGIALFVGHSSSVDEILKQADIALYQAKALGRNTLCFFNSETQSSVNAQAVLINDLRLALAKNQLKLFYQLEVSHSQDIIGAEVLLRWDHPKLGLVSPHVFIPLAEETGLIRPIGQWVLESACAVLKSWEKSTDVENFQLAVNISVRQFHLPNFVHVVLTIIRDAGIDPRKLLLELTESVVLADLNDAAAKMNTLKAVGVRFSLDDFGTGYSSLAYLTRLPFDQLKIDQSFVQNIGVNPSDAIIIKAIIAMAKELGIGIVAEGVETEAQRDFLEQHGCPVFQGYLFGKPMPIEELGDNLNFNSTVDA